MMTRESGFVIRSLLFLLAIVALIPTPSRAQTSGALSAESLMAKLKWRSVGPYIGGRVVTVTGVAGRPDLFYAGAVGGGVWKSVDEGVEWKNITDGKLPGPSSSIGAVAVAPSDPNTIYVGTGEADIRNDMIPGNGVFKSTDGGETWHDAGLRDTHSISAIVVDANDPNIVYAASMGHVFKPDPERGVFKSTDGGRSWQKVLFVDDKTGAICLVSDPKNASVLYATMWQAQRMPWGLVSGGPGSGIYKSSDGGSALEQYLAQPGLAADGPGACRSGDCAQQLEHCVRHHPGESGRCVPLR